MLTVNRIYEDELHSSIEARSESLQTLRELGPPDLVHLIKQPIKSATKQVRLVSNKDSSEQEPHMWHRLAYTTMSLA